MSFQHEKETRMILIGDSGVGKTSLVLSLVNEHFVESVPRQVEEIFIPGDTSRENIPTCIVDCSSCSDEELDNQIRQADVVIVVYGIGDCDSFDSISEKWLPLINKNCSKSTSGGAKPIILVGNKVDLCVNDEDKHYSLEDSRLLMDKHCAIETCLQTSALSLSNISQLFYQSQKAVLYPSFPLYDFNERKLSEKCYDALVRIFHICDSDNDSLLSDCEVAVFQERCFNMELTASTLSSLKEIVSAHTSSSVTCLSSEGFLTLEGFIVLCTLLIEQGRHDTLWTFLRQFGYNDHLGFDESYLSPEIRDYDKSACLELSHEGYEFLIFLFHKFDKDCDGALSPTEFENIFETCPGGEIPWGSQYQQSVQTNSKGWLDLKAFLSLWTLASILETSKTLKYFAYLGFPYYYDGQKNALGSIRVTRRRRRGVIRRHPSSSSSSTTTSSSTRTVYRCHVIGARHTGKSTFCHAFIHSTSSSGTTSATAVTSHTVNAVDLHDPSAISSRNPHAICYLILQDNISGFLASQCDVCCLIYDVSNPKSFEYCAKIYLKHFLGENGETENDNGYVDKIGVMMIGNKSDLNVSSVLPQQSATTHLNPAAFCAKYGISGPYLLAAKKGVNGEIFQKLAHLAVTGGESEDERDGRLSRSQKSGEYDNQRFFASVVIVTSCCVVLTGFIFAKYAHKFS